MKNRIVNVENITEYDTKMEKARAIIIDEKNQFYVCNMNGSILLPGGTIEEGEQPIVTLIRELEEELGLHKINPIEWMTISYYHNQFPKYKQEGLEKRLNVVYYYLLPIHSQDITSSSFTKYELENNEKIETYSFSELLDLLTISTNNPWKKFTDIELKYILEEYQQLVVEQGSEKHVRK